MSKQNLVKLMQAAGENEQLSARFQQAGSFEAVKTLATEQGFDLGDLSEAELERTVQVITGEITEELSDEELELVAGGFNIGMPPTWFRRDKTTKGFSFGVERE
jgi:predicted ribosomally synthesized peptide with nif11-like leader